jgi:hypothetical protein
LDVACQRPPRLVCRPSGRRWRRPSQRPTRRCLGRRVGPLAGTGCQHARPQTDYGGIGKQIPSLGLRRYRSCGHEFCYLPFRGIVSRNQSVINRVAADVTFLTRPMPRPVTSWPAMHARFSAAPASSSARSMTRYPTQCYTQLDLTDTVFSPF